MVKRSWGFKECTDLENALNWGKELELLEDEIQSKWTEVPCRCKFKWNSRYRLNATHEDFTASKLKLTQSLPLVMLI
jgi:hypothetical protein